MCHEIVSPWISLTSGGLISFPDSGEKRKAADCEVTDPESGNVGEGGREQRGRRDQDRGGRRVRGRGGRRDRPRDDRRDMDKRDSSGTGAERVGKRGAGEDDGAERGNAEGDKIQKRMIATQV